MKKTKLMTKVMAVVFALAILFAMSVPAFAVDTTTDGQGPLDSNTPNPAIRTVTSNTLTLNKTIIVFNPESVDVYEPDVTYTYTIAPVTIDTTTPATVTDYNNVSVTVKSGENGGLTVTTPPTFSSTRKVAAKSAGTTVEQPIVLTIDPTKFSSAGVYRYALTDTTNVANTLNTVGITRPTAYETVRYIDLYVQNDPGQNPAFKVENAVVFAQTQSSVNPTTGSIISTTNKTTGYNESTQADNDYTDDTLADHYYTYNLKVEKETTGTLGDKNHAFPFTVSFSGIKSSVITYAGVGVASSAASDKIVSNGTLTEGSLTTGSTLKLKDGEYVTFYGLPYGATATVEEYNDTLDEYKAKANDTKTTYASTEVKLTSDVTLTSRTSTAKATLASINIDAGTAHNATDLTQTSTNTTVAHFHNDLANISPTGLAFRIAPYVLMLAAGVSLIVLFAKRRREITDMI